MTKEICRYHNDLNKIRLPNLAELEQDLLFSIITKIRNKPKGTRIFFTNNDLREMLKRNSTNEELFKIAHDLRYKFFKADFTIILPQDERGRYGNETINLFKTFKMWWYINERNVEYLDELELVVNERFEYILNELIGNYTEFELAEFISLSGKYTKRLYTHLKQFRTTGEWLVKWSDFKDILGIPANYRPCDIDTFVLKQAIKELTAERTLFDQKRIPFKNLTFQKLTHNKEPNRKRLKPYWIRFTFTKEHSTQSLNIDLNGKYFLQKDSTNREFVYRVIEVKKEPKKIIIVCSVFDKRMNSISPYFTFDFKDFVEAEQFVMKNLYTIS